MGASSCRIATATAANVRPWRFWSYCESSSDAIEDIFYLGSLPFKK
jgi:hypothetical protein